MLELMLFGVLPLAALSIFVAGTIYRVIGWVLPRGNTSLASVAVRSYSWGVGSRAAEILKRITTFYTLLYSDKLLFIGAFLFHWGIFTALILGHTALFFTEKQLEAFGITPQLHEELALYVGGAAGLAASSGWIILAVRRVARRDVRALSFLDDWFALALVGAIVLLGTYITLAVHPNYMETVSPWLRYLLSGDLASAVERLAAAEPSVKAHVLLASLLIAYVPFGKMMHPFAVFFEPTLTQAPYKVDGSLPTRGR
ncbi:MAG: respiratory nitrate reductase subunit gamma [Thermoproteus sp.]|nr:respiratory nitrate reductase subunit gamma [Thermoproteus sp.]